MNLAATILTARPAGLVPGLLGALAVPGQAEGDGGTTSTTAAESPAGELVEQITDLSSACGEGDTWFCNQVYDWTGNESLAGAAEWFVAKPFSILVIVVVAIVVNRLLRSLVRRTLQRTLLDPTHRDRMQRLRDRTPNVLLATQPTNLRAEARAQTLITVFRGMVTVAVWFVAVVAILEVLEINLGPLIAGAGIAGIALGFGAQNLVRDFLSGTFIILEDQYGVGDIVDLGEAVGVVEKVTLRVTRLRDVNGVVWHVPNGEIVRVANKSQDWARALLDVSVAYDTDLEAAEQVIRDTANALAADPEWSGRVLEEPEVWGVEQFGPDGVVMRVVLKTQPAAQFDVLRELRRRVKEAFDANGIEIPFQQRTLWIRNDGALPGAPGEGAPDEAGAGSAEGSDGSGGSGGRSTAGEPPPS